MDNQQNLDSQSLKDRAWTTDEIRKHSSNWTLAGDIGLFNLLNEFSHQIISRTHEVENAVDSLVHQTKMTSAKINNVINDFHMLSNLQFVENRVYDEEVQEPVSETKPSIEKTKEQKEAEMLPKIMQAIELGLAVLDTAFDRINVNEISDSEDEEDMSSEGRTILEPKDPYESRPLPYIIGSEEFMKCDYAGLKDLLEDDAQSFSEESSSSETDETSSNEGEPLPLDDDKFSEKQNDDISQNISDKISSSDESELFGSEKEVNGFESDSSLDFKSKEKNIQRATVDAQPEKETQQNSISSLQSKLKLPQVLPAPKLQDRKKDDLFANEDNSDEESPFRKKTGLFTSDVRFSEEKDDGLFGDNLFGKSPERVKEIKTEPPLKPALSIKNMTNTSEQEIRKPTLFDNDEDSEDDIFNTLKKTKKQTITKTSNAGSQDSPERADTSSTPSSAPSTKPSGNAFDFVTGGGNSDSLFGDDSDGDDLFSNKNTQGKAFEFDPSENDDLFGIISTKTPKESKSKKESETHLLTKKKEKDSIFEDSDSSDQEKQVLIKSPVSILSENKKEISLFGDDDLDDIFSQVNQENSETEVKKETKNLILFDEVSKQAKSKENKPVKTEKSKPLSLFDESKEIIPKEAKPVKAVEKLKSLNLFDDSEEDSAKNLSNVTNIQQNKSLSLFEDNDNFDLFISKSSVKQIEPTIPVQVPKLSTVELPKAKDEIDGIVTSKISSPIKVENVDRQTSFEFPVDSSSVLNVINKSRVKVTTRRRKPTRQGRLAALENSEKEAKTDLETVPISSNLGILEDDSGNLFSASITKTVRKSEPKLDYKSEEKKKMNLMSQLMSEVTTLKIVQKKVVDKIEDEDDEFDIFSEAAKKDRSKSSFSFRPPAENGIASMFPIEKNEEKTDNSNVSKSDSFEDDFFTEPAFQNFRPSISHKDSPVFDLEEEDDDDLFSAIKSNVLPKAMPEASDSNDLFGDDTDIFADVQKEKYEMFPNQMYDDEDDDIFSNVSNTISNKSLNSSANKINNSSTVKKVETQQVNAFDDPLTGLLGEE